MALLVCVPFSHCLMLSSGSAHACANVFKPAAPDAQHLRWPGCCCRARGVHAGPGGWGWGLGGWAEACRAAAPWQRMRGWTTTFPPKHTHTRHMRHEWDETSSPRALAAGRCPCPYPCPAQVCGHSTREAARASVVVRRHGERHDESVRPRATEEGLPAGLVRTVLVAGMRARASRCGCLCALPPRCHRVAALPPRCRRAAAPFMRQPQ